MAKTKKSEQTREKILMAAGDLFNEKGFTKVTMSDICKRTGLSRGGLYNNFSSTKEIYHELLEGVRYAEDRWVEEQSKIGKTPIEVLDAFLEWQKQELLTTYQKIPASAYEYFVEAPDESYYLSERFQASNLRVMKIIQLGQKEKVFVEGPAERLARTVTSVIDGLRVCQPFQHLSSQAIDEQMEILKSLIIKK